jgi:hypothetical protein
MFAQHRTANPMVQSVYEQLVSHSQSHITTDSQSVSQSWLRAPFLELVITCLLRKTFFVRRGASALTGGLVYHVTGHSLCLCRIYNFFLFSFFLLLRYYYFLHICIYICMYIHTYIYEGRLQSSWIHYCESELCGGAVTVCFSKYIPWQAMHILQRSTHFSKKCLGAPF